jgi:hypothetical protein
MTGGAVVIEEAGGGGVVPAAFFGFLRALLRVSGLAGLLAALRMGTPLWSVVQAGLL